MATCFSSNEEEMSPRTRVKFLCSYGGKILPRPSDGQLKYIGGDTRVIAVPRSISFSELKKKMDIVYNGEAVVKYQLMPEDLDALVSVTCDEDLRYMFDEHDRQPRSPSTGCGSPRLRVFLFPTSSSPSAAATTEQRYLDAINGIPIMPQAKSSRQHSIFTLSSSACTSPTSTIDMSTMGLGGLSCGRASGGGMHRVHSTPNIGSLRIQTITGNNMQQQQHQHYHFPQKSPSLQRQHSLTYGMYLGSGSRSTVGASIRYQQPYPQPTGMYCLRPPLAAAGPQCTNSGHMEETYGLGHFYNSAAHKHGFD